MEEIDYLRDEFETEEDRNFQRIKLREEIIKKEKDNQELEFGISRLENQIEEELRIKSLPKEKAVLPLVGFFEF